MDYAKTGRLIAERRKELNMTQSALAEKLGVTNKAVSRWETGGGFPDVSLLEGLSGALGLSVMELLQGEAIEGESVSKARADDSVLMALGEAETMSRAKKIENTVWVLIVFIGLALSLASCISVGARDEWTMGNAGITGQVLYGMKFGWDGYVYAVYDDNSRVLSLAMVEVDEKFLWRFKSVSDAVSIDLGKSGSEWAYTRDEDDEHFFYNKSIDSETFSCSYGRYPPLRALYDDRIEWLYIGVTRTPEMLEGKTVHYTREIDGLTVFAYSEIKGWG